MITIQAHPEFDALIVLAVKEQWKEVDARMANFANLGYVLIWTRIHGLISSDENIRDFAASLWEKSSCEFLSGVEDRLREMTEKDTSRYVRFRAACALLRHSIQSEGIVRIISEFLDDSDPELAKIAEQYLLQRVAF